MHNRDIDRTKSKRECEEALLTPREAALLAVRYWGSFIGAETRTLKEASVLFGISRERARHLEKEALRKVRDLAMNEPTFSSALEAGTIRGRKD